ncbi:hypothetical protein [Photobacterium leiognathi]|uniref:Uncharacterized protein n=1 Tax=Photobacterium leiognathi TaxID=553611 RepID=A0A2T3M5E9_PHOLE|nr:hypothetical protein [Photobacterium leiognathi]PSV87118.1 hypothetical protein CTM89_18785 [Photobacterium leiognathi]
MRYLTVVMLLVPFVLSAHIAEVDKNDICKIDIIKMMKFVENLDYESEKFKKIEPKLNEINSLINHEDYCSAVDKLTKALQ